MPPKTLKLDLVNSSHRVSIRTKMATKKKAVAKKRPKLTVRQKAREAGEAPNRKAPRQEWPKAWTALFRLTENSPEKFADAVGVSYQTIWRAGIKGERLGNWSAFLIQQFAVKNGLRSPV